jgi:hypothetical protein
MLVIKQNPNLIKFDLCVVLLSWVGRLRLGRS